jgi:hypothetical protein
LGSGWCWRYVRSWRGAQEWGVGTREARVFLVDPPAEDRGSPASDSNGRSERHGSRCREGPGCCQGEWLRRRERFRRGNATAGASPLRHGASWRYSRAVPERRGEPAIAWGSSGNAKPPALTESAIPESRTRPSGPPDATTRRSHFPERPEVPVSPQSLPGSSTEAVSFSPRSPRRLAEVL